MKPRAIAFNLALGGAAIAATLALAEVALHFLAPESYRAPPSRLSDDVWRELLHRPSKTEGLTYELVPERQKVAQGAVVRTNHFGMRDDEPRPRLDAQVRRIAVLGDSYTFGFGVPGDSTYPNVLERLLNARIGKSTVEVLNFGVGGYSTRDEAHVLAGKALEWNPSLVVIGYVLNDPEIDPIQPLHAYYQKAAWWQHLEMGRRIARARNRRDIIRLGGGDYYRYLHAPDERKWKSVVEAFGAIDRLARARDIPVLVVVFPVTTRRPWSEYPYRDLHVQVWRAARDSGLDAIDLFDYFAAHDPSEIQVAPGDDHPSVRGHEVAAEAILRWILERDALVRRLGIP